MFLVDFSVSYGIVIGQLAFGTMIVGAIFMVKILKKLVSVLGR